MRAWAMALRVRGDGSRPTMMEALEAAEIHPTRKACLEAAAGVFDTAEWQPVQIEVRLLTKITPRATSEETTR